MMINRFLSFTIFLALTTVPVFGADTLPPLTDGKVPRSLEELWAGYDPAQEPLEVEVVRQWQRGDATVRMLVYTVGTFKGEKSRMGAYYAFPTKHAAKIPGILLMHGGGQRAMSEMVEAAAANGYAAISINWGGKPMKDQEPGDAGGQRLDNLSGGVARGHNVDRRAPGGNRREAELPGRVGLGRQLQTLQIEPDACPGNRSPGDRIDRRAG